MTVSKPGNYLNWVPSADPGFIQNPTTGQKATGWVYGESPPFEYMNWLFYYCDQWIQWFDQVLTPGAVGINATPTVLVTTADITLNSWTMNVVGSTTGIAVGQLVTGSGLAAGTYVHAVSGPTVTLSRPATATLAANPTTFSHAYATGGNVQAEINQLDSAAFAASRLASGYNKVVGGLGIPTLSLANIQAGDSVLVVSDVSESGQILIAVNDVRIDFAPGATLLSTYTSGSVLKVTGRRFESRSLKVKANGALASGFGLLELTGDDAVVSSARLELNNAGIALAAAVKMAGSRNDITSGSIVATSGTYTNSCDDTGTNNDSRLRG